MIDLFSKWAEGIAIRNKEATTVAKVIFEVWISRLGVPIQLLSDRGKEFECSVLKELCRLLNIDKLRTTAYKPSTNGAIERMHRTMNSMLAKMVTENQRDWDEKLPMVMAAYRASPHEATGFSPNYLVFGKENRAPVDIVYDAPTDNYRPGTYDEYAELKVDQMRQAYTLVRKQLGVSAERMKHHYDMRVKSSDYVPGAWVYFYNPRRFKNRSPKWQCLYTGPYLITKLIGPVNVVLQQSKRGVPFVTHMDKLKLCYGTTPVDWRNQEKDDEKKELDVSANEAPRRRLRIGKKSSTRNVEMTPRPIRTRKPPQRFLDVETRCCHVVEDV